MSATAAGDRVLELGTLRVEIGLAPLRIHVRRAGRRLLRALTVWACEGEVRDRFVQVTEGVIADERLGFPERVVAATIAAADERSDDDRADAQRRAPRASCASSSPAPSTSCSSCRRRARRCAWPSSGTRARRSASPGSGARHALRVDHAGRAVQLGADRAYTGPDCPPDMRELGGIPQGDYAPAPFLQSSRGYALWCETYANGTRFELDDPSPSSPRRGVAGPLRLHVLTDPTPVARLRRYVRLTGLPALLPGVGLRLLEVARRLPAPGRRRGGRPRLSLARHPARRDRARLAVGDAIQHVGAQPAPVPGLRRDGRALARDRRAHRRVGHAVGQPRVARRADPARPRLAPPAPRAGAQLRAAALRPQRRRRAVRRALVDGHGVDGRLHRPRERGVVARAGRARAAPRRGGDQGRRRRGLLRRRGPALRRRDDGRAERVALRRPVPPLDAARARRGARSRARRALRPQRLERPAGRPACCGPATRPRTSGRCARSWRRASPPPAAASRTGRTTSAATSATAWSSAARRSCCCAGSSSAAFTPLMQAHGRLEQEPWTYDRETLELYRGYVLLHEMLNPYLRAAAASAARGGPPILRPASLLDPGGWEVADAFGVGAGALGRAGRRGGSARARRVAAAGRVDRGVVGRARARRARGGGAGAAARDSRVGPRRRDRRHAPRRVGALRRSARATRRCTRRCGASRAAGAPWPGWPTGRSCGGSAGAGRPTAGPM